MPTTRSLESYVDGQSIGSFREANGQITFEYDAGATFPLSLSMPIDIALHKNKVAHAYLWGLLPDNAEALSAMAKEASTSPNSVFGLLSYHGNDVAGAMQLLPPGVAPSDATRTSISHTPERLSQEELESVLLNTIKRYHGQPLPDMAREFKFSVAGAQPKIALTADEDGNFLPPTKKHATTHIIKPADPRSDYYIKDIDSLEVICLDAAYRIGITATEAYRWHAPSGDLSATVLRRYDRYLADDGVVHRSHQEDFCQALSVMPDKKYQHIHGGPGLADMRDAIAKGIPGEQRYGLLTELFQQVVFNVGILGTDAHAKNYSIMHGAGEHAIAPLYDSISAATLLTGETRAYFPMKIGNTYALDEITPTALVESGIQLGLADADSFRIVEKMLSRIPEGIESAANDLGEHDLGQKVLDGIARFSPVRLLN